MSEPGLGHNNPPEPTPYEASVSLVEGLYGEAHNWLDGALVETQEQADEIGKLIRLCQEAGKTVDANRIKEKRPHDDAAAEVQARYKPLAAKLDTAVSVAKKALTPFMQAQMKRQQEEAEAKRAAAEAARKAAEAAAFEATDLASVEQREAAIAAAKAAERDAAKAEKGKATVSTGKRAIGLRTVRKATVIAKPVFLRHLWTTSPEVFDEFLQAQANRCLAFGPNAPPGVEFTEEKVPV